MKRLETPLALLLGAVFLLAGGLKLPDPNGFAMDVYGFRLLPWNGALVVGFYLPWLEVVGGAALWLRRTRCAALAILATLVFGFLAAVGSALARGLDVTCGCFGKASNHSLWATLIIDLLLLAGLGVLWFFNSRARTGRSV